MIIVYTVQSLDLGICFSWAVLDVLRIEVCTCRYPNVILCCLYHGIVSNIFFNMFATCETSVTL